MTERKKKGNDFPNISEVAEHNEQNKAGGAEKEKEGIEKPRLGNNYWERVSDDAASGYETKEDEDDVLNIDQEPGDNEVAHKVPDE